MSQRRERLSTEQLRSREVADALWLAAHIGVSARATAGGDFAHRPPDDEPVSHATEERAEDHRPEAPSEQERVSVQGTPTPEALGMIYRAGTGALGTPIGTDRITHPWPEPDWLPQEVRIARALRPLKTTVPSPRDTVLAEEKTAIRAAQDGLWLPEYEPAPMRPFDVLVVVDNSASMRIWQRTAMELRTLLERQGAFRDVRCVLVDTDKSHLTLRNAHGGTVYRHPAQVIDSTGHRIILGITDGIGCAWRTGAMSELLRGWARTAPLAVLHVLPVFRVHCCEGREVDCATVGQLSSA